MRWPIQLLSEDTDVLQAGSRLLWITIALIAVAAAAACYAGGLSVTWQKFPTIPVAIAGCAAMALFYRFFRPDPAIIYATELITQLLLVIFLSELLTYAAATTGFPCRDAELLAVDRWLGFDVKAYLGLVNSYHALAMISLLAYMSYLWQAPAVFVVLSLTARVERLQDFAVSLIVSLTITIAIFAFFPALGWYEYLRLDLSAFTNILSFRTSCLMSRSCAAELFTPFRSTASAALSASRAIMRPWQCWRSGPCGRSASYAGRCCY